MYVNFAYIYIGYERKEMRCVESAFDRNRLDVVLYRKSEITRGKGNYVNRFPTYIQTHTQRARAHTHTPPRVALRV